MTMHQATALFCFVFFVAAVHDVTGRSVSDEKSRFKRQSTTNQGNKPNEHRHDPNKFLEKFGYLPKLPEGTQHEPINRAHAIKIFQKMYNIKVTGQLDPDTLAAMAKSRCGMPDYHNTTLTTANKLIIGTSGQLAENLASGYKWRKTDLTYHIKTYYNSATFSQDAQRWALQRALKFWSDVTPLTFREVVDQGDINIQFVAGVHDDGVQNGFDGPGGVLAHAFYPESGEAHFDHEEDWRDSETDGVDLMTVAAHELGHALGLTHSSFPGALMAPYYQGYDPAFTLTTDDISAIRSIYGGGSPGVPTIAPPTIRPTTTTTTTTPPPTVPVPTRSPSGAPDSCTVTFKAITQIYDTSVHVFTDAYVWRLTEAGLDSAYPQRIQAVYTYAPETVDAAIFSWKTYYTYLYKGNKVWRYYGFRLLGGKTFDATSRSVPVMAAITDQSGNIYLIKGPTCWLFDETTMTINTVPKQCIQVFPNALTNMDSSLRIAAEQNIVYFFRGPYYYKYDESLGRIVDGYPKLKAGPWMGEACGAQPYTPR